MICIMPFSEITAVGPPGPDQIEICVFGPNYGECILAHVGNGNWVVIDSCINGGTKEPVALAYLRAIGIDPANAIRAIIATHWHDDHRRGFSQILVAAPAAHVWIASALTSPEFLQFASRMGKNKTAVAGNKLSEFSKTIVNIRTRHEAGLLSFGFASANTYIYRLSAPLSGHGFPCEILALSPSHGDVLNFMTRIAADMPRSRQTKRAVPSPQPNDVSIVTMISVGPFSVLLGADMENSGIATAGWEAIIEAHRHSPLAQRAGVYKIPHHGSENAHNAEVWDQLLSPNPWAVLTPWRKGRGRLPTQEGVAEIVSRTRLAFATAADARSRRQRRGRPPGVLRFLRESRQIKVRSLEAPFGAVRFRTLDLHSGTWQHELFGAACDLKQYRRARQV
jgi:hypothetical protein